jgi:hypothetical protein
VDPDLLSFDLSRALGLEVRLGDGEEGPAKPDRSVDK